MAYKAVNSVTNTCESLIVESNTGWNKNNLTAINIYLPIIVIEGTIHECYLDASGEACITEIAHGALLDKTPTKTRGIAHIDVITEKEFSSFSSFLKLEADSLINIVDENKELYLSEANIFLNQE
jgi:hypothetical protein